MPFLASKSTPEVATLLRPCIATSVRPFPTHYKPSLAVSPFGAPARRLLLLDQYSAVRSQALVSLPAFVYRLVTSCAQASRVGRDKRQLRPMDGGTQSRVSPTRDACCRAGSWRIDLHVRPTCVRSSLLLSQRLTRLTASEQSVRMVPLCAQPFAPDPLAQPQLVERAQPRDDLSLPLARGRTVSRRDRGC